MVWDKHDEETLNFIGYNIFILEKHPELSLNDIKLKLAKTISKLAYGNENNFEEFIPNIKIMLDAFSG